MPPRSIRASGVFLCFGLQTEAAYASAPLNYLHGDGNKAYPVVHLTWGLIGISLAVIVIISLLVGFALWRRSGLAAPAPGDKLPVERPEKGLEWIWTGVSLTALALVAAIVWTVMTLNDIRAPHVANPLTIEVTGHQWWWEVHYPNPNPALVFTTANEIHIPTGVPVFFKLKSADVIHSFWVPALSGKTDTIPGLANETWLEADKPGVYHGQCQEYCGLNHANMRLLVIAQKPAEFDAWRAHQLEAPVMQPAVQAGETQFGVHCASCHAVRGTTADGVLGPDLSHLMDRETIAAGVLANNADNLLRWISDPQAIKPGSRMPRPAATQAQLNAIRTYLTSLK